MLKNLLCKISAESPQFRFIPHDINPVTNLDTMKYIIVAQNIFLEEMDIVLITWILKLVEIAVMDSFK